MGTMPGMVAKDIEAYRLRLEAKRHELLDTIAKIEVDGRETTSDVNIRDFGDRANDAFTKETLFLQGSYDRAVLGLVQAALQRAGSGAFGVCVECGQPVEEKRLGAIPWARHCIRCQELQDKGLL